MIMGACGLKGNARLEMRVAAMKESWNGVWLARQSWRMNV